MQRHSNYFDSHTEDDYHCDHSSWNVTGSCDVYTSDDTVPSRPTIRLIAQERGIHSNYVTKTPTVCEPLHKLKTRVVKCRMFQCCFAVITVKTVPFVEISHASQDMPHKATRFSHEIIVSQRPISCRNNS